MSVLDLKTIRAYNDSFYSLNERQYEYLKSNVMPGILRDIFNGSPVHLSTAELLIRFAIKEKCLSRGYEPVKVEFKETGANRAAGYDNLRNVIVFNTNFVDGTIYELNKNDLNSQFNLSTDKYPSFNKSTRHIDRLFMCSFHECEHYFQYSDFESKILTKNSFSALLNIIFNTRIDNHNYLNYAYKEIENYATTEGWYDVSWFYAKMGIKQAQTIKPFRAWLQSIARNEGAFQNEITSEGTTIKSIIEDYNISKLSEVIKAHKGYLYTKGYEMLNHFYDRNTGDIKPVIELVRDYNDLDRKYIEEYKKRSALGYDTKRLDPSEPKYVYRQFFYYLLSKGSKFDFYGADSVLTDMANNDLRSLEYIFDFKNKDENTPIIVEKKIERVLGVLSLLSQNKSIYCKTPENPEDSNRYHERVSSIISNVSETLKVYETSKLMYSDSNPLIERSMQNIRKQLGLHTVEYREPKGRESALNI